MQKITPFLWFNNTAEEAINFYVSIFRNSKIISIDRYPEDVPVMGGKVLTAVFELQGQQFMALDGGPQYPFTPAISLFVSCEDQEEVDELWEQLLEGGKANQCGWLQDKYGLSWQIIPEALPRLLQDPDRTKAGRVLQAMMRMVKIDIAALEEAYNGSE